MALGAAALTLAAVLVGLPAEADTTPTGTPSGTPTDSPSPTPTDSPTDTPSPTPTDTPTDTPSPTDSPSPTPTGTAPVPDAPVPPTEGDPVRPDVPVSTSEEVAARQAEARALAAAIADQADALQVTRDRVDELATEYDAAMTAKEEADARRVEARAEQDRQEARLEGARQLVALRQGELGRWASQAYRSGGPANSSIESWMTLLQTDHTDDLAQSVQMVEQVGRWRGSVVDTVEEAEAVQRDATRLAGEAADQAATESWHAFMAAQQASSLLEQQRLQIAVLTELLSALSGQSEGLVGTVDASARARAAAAQLRLQAENGVGNAVTGPVGTCPGADISSYPNGSVPVAALCPLWAAPGHHLRADAAYAFQQLSEAYALTFGDPLCVTDSYRTLAEQVSVYATKPGLAAEPGTSNHGWGTATDLCGGVQNFGTPQHVWMQQNAPLFGFFHPTWAQAGGSRPEPWHWEYAS